MDRITTTQVRRALQCLCDQYGLDGPASYWNSAGVGEGAKSTVGALGVDSHSPGDGMTRTYIVAAMNESGGERNLNSYALRPAEMLAALNFADALILHMVKVGALARTPASIKRERVTARDGGK